VLYEFFIPLVIKEESGIERILEPVSFGVPFPKGEYHDISSLSVLDQDSTEILFDTKVLDNWSDGSLRWVLFDFLISMVPNTEKTLKIIQTNKKKFVNPETTFSVQENANEFIIKSNRTEFHVDKQTFKPFNSVLIDDKELAQNGSSLTFLIDEKEEHWTPKIEFCHIEDSNKVKTTLSFKGYFTKENKSNDIRFQSKLFFYAGHSFCMCDFTILNPKAATHPEGFWDLGNAGSIFFKELSLDINLSSTELSDTLWRTEPFAPIESVQEDLVIYQDSSGGGNWQSRNHINRHKKNPLGFKGYRVLSSGKKISEGLRASPVISVTNGHHAITATMKDFWQNFPSAIESSGNGIRISLFPKYYNDGFELQGGEQKTHQTYVNFSNDVTYNTSLEWTHTPLIIEPSSEWYTKAKVFSYIVPKKNIPDEKDLYNEIFALVETGIKGNNTFASRREIIDEYGWRNFGDLYADHENRLCLGEKPIISHYNNQYDVINSFIFQYISSGNKDWFKLAEDLARHIIDIDIYHTDQDSYVYNHGLFWHTDHFASAQTATHRSFSKQTIVEDKNYTIKDGVAATYKHYGSGPSVQHVYTQGLLNYYYLTGDTRSRDSVLELADFVVKCVQGPKDTISLLKKVARNSINWFKDRSNQNTFRPYGLAEGPDRGSGNALSVLLDAFILKKDKDYLSQAEFLIRECIHPKDNIKNRNLLEINTRWSYIIFLQAVGKYLDIKTELNEFNYMFSYAKETLLNYALWMLDHEVSILSLSDSFDFPNHSTRVANDIRKANVLYIASKYASVELKIVLRKKAKFFFEDSCRSLLSFDTRSLTRPLALLMQNMYVSIYFHNNIEETPEIKEQNNKYGSPKNRDSLRWLIIENLKLFFKILPFK